VLSWRFDKTIAGFGVLGDIISHVIDMSHFLVGPIAEVISTGETFIKQRPLPGAHLAANSESSQDRRSHGEVTNEDYVSALVRFANGGCGTMEASRVITGPKCQMAFEANGTMGAVSWDFERMNELDVCLPDTPEHDGYTRICTSSDHPFYSDFYPIPANSLSYEDLKAIEAFHFLRGIRDGVQGTPGFKEALAVAEVQAAMERSWQSRTWEAVRNVRHA
jgi:predicted dehydrogenase